MTTLDKWSVFFQYASDPNHRETVNKVIESEEVLTVAGNLLMSISQNEVERARFRSRRKFQTDLQSDLVTAKDIGKQEGRIEIARKMLDIGEPVDKVMLITGLTREEVEGL